MFVTSMIAYLAKQIKRVEPVEVTYGNELEQYIVSKNPQSVAEVEFWTEQYDRKASQRNWPL